MISLMTDITSFDELSDLQKAVFFRYFEIFKSFYYDKNYTYPDLISQLVDNEELITIHDNGEKLKHFLEAAVESNRLPVIILTHQFIPPAIQIPKFDNETNRNFPYNFLIFHDFYGILLLKNLIQNRFGTYYLRRLYRAVPTWDDILSRVGADILQESSSGITALNDFYKGMLLSSDFPVMWFYPEGTSRGFDRGMGFKKGIFYLLKIIEEDRKLLDKFNCQNIAVCFVDQYNVKITDKAFECKLNLLHEFSQGELNKCITNFGFGTSFLAELVYKYRINESEFQV